MSITISHEEIREMQNKYDYLVNYESDDPNQPINPLSYVDSNGDSLLHIAAQQGDLRTIELLLKAGVDVNKIGDMGSTALHCAYKERHTDVVSFLLSHGASEKIQDEFGKLPGE